ncbi:hypothetical protein FNF27_00510 [Cafeteria roenbergensis]|uniref:Uncharacterized protein n=1 Tax=Cafeteria roenbergensis TaxID=33653 RepID=A0A5A8EKF3_CAFRO|nr:hypothetical protein FNF27_00510 [Cafeteria roenbergensis]|mmetsp:Transcript_20388/g.78337  ORF Transcript_20388/g.78337 Transcript_20388/m.78337 type:complete len:316 (+) Transcript_20388:59-1006(+)
MAASSVARSTAISAGAIREVVADVVGLNDAAVGAVDDAIEDMLVGFDEVAALMERVTERRIELSRTTLARVEALSAALPAALQAVSAAEECVAAASTSLDGYAARLAHLEAAWAARTGEKPAQAGASAVLSGLFSFRRPGASAPPAAAAPALVERPPPPQAWDPASCRLPTASLAAKLGRAGQRAKQGLAEADAIDEDHEAGHAEEWSAGAPGVEGGEGGGADSAETVGSDVAGASADYSATRSTAGESGQAAEGEEEEEEAAEDEKEAEEGKEEQEAATAARAAADTDAADAVAADGAGEPSCDAGPGEEEEGE